MRQLLLLFTFGVGRSLAQLYLFNITEPIDGLSSTCIAVLNQALACDPFLLGLTPDEWESDDVLDSICTSTCTMAWSTYLRRVSGACGTSRYDGGNGFLYLPAINIEPVYEQYQLLCLKDSWVNVLSYHSDQTRAINNWLNAFRAGEFCNAVIRDIMGIDPDTQARSSGAPEPGT